MDLLDSMKIYALTVERGSLSAAATAYGISATMAGNHLRQLEKRLGVRLLQRTTRRQQMTEFGAEYYARCKEILRLIAETDAQAQDRQLAPTGTLRITAPVTFGTEALVPALSEYLDLYPAVSIDLTLSNRVVDLIEDGFDAAIRIGHLSDSSLIAKTLSPDRLMLCASPAYLARRGTPTTPADLSKHECLAFSPSALLHWQMADGEATYDVAVCGRFRTNHGQALRVAALQGMGIVLQAAILLEEDVRAGRLVPLLPSYRLPLRPMSIVYLPDPYRSPKLRSFVDFICERFA
ncbi:MAG: LysR family transcriptional regulator [Luteibacter jiangsuensis]